jgi:hypothetical protein
MTLLKLDEPDLLFAHDQPLADPRDGLTLFGPLDEGKPYGIRAGIIGTSAGIKRFERYIETLQRPIITEHTGITRPYFPGFTAAFRIPWSTTPAATLTVDDAALQQALYIDDRYQRIAQTVDAYAAPLLKNSKEGEARPDVWFVIIPDEVHKYCRPQSTIETAKKIITKPPISRRRARKLRDWPSMFREENEVAAPYQSDPDFHHQLKARLLATNTPTQIIRESTIAPNDFLKTTGKPIRDLSSVASDIAWNISSAAFYKSAGRPWKLANIRPGVCYLGLVYKKDERSTDPRAACCAAQLFLDSGDGLVFKGALGPWHTPHRPGHFHLGRHQAADLLRTAVESYTALVGNPPAELFIHGKIAFNDEEWRGFQSVITSATRLTGIRIKDASDIKLYRHGEYVALRGLADVTSGRQAILWTRGYVPRLQTYPGREVPNPLHVDIVRGDADIEVVLKDVLALTKVNYNSCIFADGTPVTLRFANAIGEILTAIPATDTVPPLPFRMYI